MTNVSVFLDIRVKVALDDIMGWDVICRDQIHPAIRHQGMSASLYAPFQSASYQE